MSRYRNVMLVLLRDMRDGVEWQRINRRRIADAFNDEIDHLDEIK